MSILREGWGYQPPTSNSTPYPDFGKLPNFQYLFWSATPTSGLEPDDFQPRAQIKRLFQESELVSGVSGDSEVWVVHHIFLPMVLRCARFARNSSAYYIIDTGDRIGCEEIGDSL